MELTWCRAQLLLLATACVSSLEVLERVVHTPENNVICPQALSNCSVSDTEPIEFMMWTMVVHLHPDDEEDSAIVESENEDEYSGELDSRCVPTPNNTPEGRRNSLSEDHIKLRYATDQPKSSKNAARD
ncbi:hypothetical protein F2P79_011705 [Pimephales promelas]|nr:hypothetical protein F2P79_011705 [Pimephales promelas]